VSLFKSASLVSLLTLASRITGLVRELLMASTFGASALTDAFNVAFRIPNLLRRLFAEGAFSQAFVPVLAGVRAKEGDEATRELVDQIATVLVWALVLTCVWVWRARRCWSGRWPAASSRARRASRRRC
jgi:putative peptidoglycan lipid II flippase